MSLAKVLCGVGVFQGVPWLDFYHPHPFELPAMRDRQLKLQILTYLQGGLVLNPFMKKYWLDLGRAGKVTVGIWSYTDGVWWWPDELIHYYRAYDFQLPEEFVAAAAHNHFQIPEGLMRSDYEPLRVDEDRWIRWVNRVRRKRLRAYFSGVIHRLTRPWQEKVDSIPPQAQS
jgi:hypothetical protein